MLILDLSDGLQGFIHLAFESDVVSFFQEVVQWSAILLTALAGTYAARKQGLDYFGTLVIAFVVCVGGGTIRDIVIGRFPVFWLESPAYLVTILGVSFFGLFIQQGVKKDKGFRKKIARPIDQIFGELSTIFLIIDSLALGLWAYLGTFYALSADISPYLAPVLGVITAIFGGVLRDVFFARIPQQFLPGQLYATAAAAGSIVFVLFYDLGVSDPIGFIVCVAVTFIIRVVSVKFNIMTS